jgi:hypothetical protein
MVTFENKTDASSAVKYGKANACEASRVAVEGRTEKTRINPIASAKCGRNQSSFAYVAQAGAKGEEGEKMSKSRTQPAGEPEIYIAGPMRGIRHFNFPAFDAAVNFLSDAGWWPISPAALDRQSGFDEKAFPDDYDWIDLKKAGFSLHDAIDRDVQAIKQCKAIYMLDGWENSKGARAEKALAEWLGLEVLYQTPPKNPEAQKPKDVLAEALAITSGDRNASYGPPDQDFRRTADMWSGLFGDMLKDGARFEPFHIAQAMILLKMSRQLHQRKRDNWVDAAGYARCGAICDEVASK